jgi:hypothetical protein
MKTSKIIFIALLSSIAIIILVAMISIRISGYKSGDPASDFLNVKTGLVPAFNVLYINNAKNVKLFQGDSNKITILAFKNTLIPKANYKVNGDTLWFFGFDDQISQMLWVEIQIANKLNNIQLKNSELRISNYNSAALSLDLNNSKINFFPASKTNAISKIDITAINHSEINVYSLKVDSSNIVLQNSIATFGNRLVKIHGSLSDYSRISLRLPEEVYLKRDSTSKIFISER